MLKFKNYIILLLLMLFAFAGQAWATNPTYTGWHTYTAKIKVNETGLGKVYGSFGTSDDGSAHNPTAARNIYIVTQHRWASVKTEDQSSNEFNLYLYAVANESTEEGVSYEFVEWQNEKGERVKTSNQEEGTASISKFVTTNKCGPGFTSSQGTGTNNFYQPHQDYHNSITTVDQESGISIVGHIDSTYVAVFRRVYKPRLVTVSINDDNLGFVECNPTPFDYGKEVTLLTIPKPESEKGFENKFIGWKKDGEFLRDGNGDIVRDVPLKFTVSEETQGHYEAVYESGYKFFHLVNKSTKRTVNAVNDQGSITDFSSLQLVDYDERLIDAGSIFQIDNYKVAGGYPHEFIVQGSNTGDYYTINPGSSEYITIERNVDDLTWSIHPNGQPLYMADEGEGSVTTNVNKGDEITHWFIECIDKNLETCENYFSLDPDKLIEVGGKYYTTLRTSWNILFNPDQMTPYVVTEVDEVNGTFDMEPITGNNDNVNNIIPAGTPVIIETKSKVVLDNRMVPTTTRFAGTIPEPNKLETSEKYFPNQKVDVESKYKKLIRNENGQLAFGGDVEITTVQDPITHQSTTYKLINGNEAYLSVDNEVVKIETLPLSEIEQVGVKNRKYIVEDLLIAVAYAEDTEGSSFLWCKDQGDKSSIFATTIHDGEQVDFLLNDENAQNGRAWDQSNWVALKFTGLTTDEAAVIRGYVNSYINEKAITGELVDDNNYILKVSAKTLATTAGASYDKNVYCTSNFVLDNLNIFGSIAEGDGGYTSGNTAQNYFFMNPKVQEACHIIYAMWDAQNSCFTVPKVSGFAGNFNVDLAYNDNPYLDLSTALTHEKVYQFDAIVNRVSKTAYEAKANRAGEFIVYPLNLTGGNENDPPTAISIVSVNREVVDVEYVNCMGVVSKHPFSGVNIVVTRYSDGSRTVEKVMK